MNQKERWYKRFFNFLRDARAELRKVTWPSRKEIYNTTLVVLFATFFFGFYLFFWDIVFSWVITKIESFFG